jgi:hypothetical protein
MKWTKVNPTFRVQVPAYSDAWMQGDRYGEVIAESRARPPADEIDNARYVYRVKLDKSGKLRVFIADDCTAL